MTKINFAYSPPDWLKDVKDVEVQSTIFGILAGYAIDEAPITDANLKKKIAIFDELTEAQAQQVYELIAENTLREPSIK